MAILTADIGGTNARFALAIPDDAGQVHLQAHQTYQAKDYETLYDAYEAYLQMVEIKRPSRACFAVAGPITDTRVELTNSLWFIDLQEAPAKMGLQQLEVVNDFKAMTYGAQFIPDTEMICVKEGKAQPKAPKVVLGPGTGLGLGILVPMDTGYVAIPTEGGHANFSPRTDEEIDVLKELATLYGHVSFERILSGQGILNVYHALCRLNAERAMFSHPGEVTAAAVEHNDPIADKALSIFCSALGVYTSNIVVTSGALGGVYLSGGILPKVREYFLNSNFTKAFLDKGNMSHYLTDVPVWLIQSQETPLIGAAKLLLDKDHDYRCHP
jgi:glucokinase